MSSTSEPLRLRERLGYATGDLSSNLYWKMIELYLLFFYTDVFGITAAAAGTMLLVGRVGDAVIDPAIGALADRTNTRHGKFRPYLIWASLPLAVMGVLAFTTPDLAPGGKLAWAYVTFGFMMAAYSLVNIPYSALLGVITSDSQERTKLASLKFVGAFTGGIVVSYLTPKLVALFGQGNPARGWQMTMLIYGVVGIGLFVITFLSTRERVTPPPEQKPRIKEDLADLLGNRPWVLLFAIGLLVIFTIALRNGTAAYYMKYVAKRPDLLGSYLTCGMISYAVGAAITPLLTRRLGKRRLYVIMMISVSILTGAFFFVPTDAIPAIFAFNIITSLVLGPKAPLVWSMFADTADFSEWRTGRRATGFVFSAATFSIKAGGALAQALTGWLLASVGYVANQAQTPSTQRGISMLISLIPAGFALLAAGIMKFYTLDEAEVARVQSEISARRQGEGSPA